MTGLIRLRSAAGDIGCVTVLVALLVLGYAPLYGTTSYVWPLAAAAGAGVVSAAAGWVIPGPVWVRAVGAGGTLLGSAVIAWGLTRGDLLDLGPGPVPGLSAVLTRNQPVDVAGDVLILPFVLTATATALSLLALLSARPLLPLLPVAVAYAGQLLLCAGFGRPVISVGCATVFTGAAVLLAGHRHGRLRGAGPAGLRMVAALIGVVVVAAGTAGGTAAATAGRHHFDPRDRWESPERDQQVTPLAIVRSDLADDADAPRFSIRIDGPAPVRRVVVARLDVFDGNAWTARPEFRLAGTLLRPDEGTAGPISARAEVTVTALPGLLLPAVGRPARLDRSGPAPVLFDRASGMLLAGTPADYVVEGLTGIDRPAPGEPSPTTENCRAYAEAASFVPLQARWLDERGPGQARLEQLATEMRERLPYNPKSPAGSSLGAIERVLEGTAPANAGNAEQHTAAFALLACGAGRPARVVVGYRLPEPSEPGVTQAVTAHDVHAWAEVYLGRAGWIAFDPTDPDKPITAPAPGAVAPPPPSPVTPADDTTAGGQADAPRPQTSVVERILSVVRSGLAPAALGAAGLLTLVLLVLLGGFVLRRLRRRWARDDRRRALEARRTAADPDDRALGAWKLFITCLSDRGLPVQPSSTPDEVGALASVAAPDAAGSAARLVVIVNSALFGPRPTTPAEADLAWDLADDLHRSLGARR